MKPAGKPARHRRKRGIAIPTGVDGIAPAAVTVTAAGATGSLLIDATAAGGPDSITLALVPGSATIIVTTTAADPTPTSTPTVQPTPTPTPTPSQATAAASHGPSVGAVVGIAAAAFAGAAFLIVFVAICMRRSSRRTKARQRGVVRNTQGQQDLRRSRLEPWAKLPDNGTPEKPRGLGDDSAYASGHGRSPDHTSPTSASRNPGAGEMEKITLFQSSGASVQSHATQATSAFGTSQAHDFYEFDPAKFGFPVEDGGSHAVAAPVGVAPTRPFQGRVDVGPPVSWDGETVKNESFLSLKDPRMSRAMSPTMVMAKQTPPATSGAFEAPLGESAVLVHPGAVHPGAVATVEYLDNNSSDDADRGFSFIVEDPVPLYSSPVRATPQAPAPAPPAEDPFVSSDERHGRRPSEHSPFFAGERGGDPFADVHAAKARALNGGRSRSSSNAGQKTAPGHHRSTTSGTSMSSQVTASEHAMQSLIAALDLTQDQVEERLRVVSGVPTISDADGVSRASTVAYTEDEAAAIRQFPLPPASEASSYSHMS